MRVTQKRLIKPVVYTFFAVLAEVSTTDLVYVFCITGLLFMR
jgi:hypothetical protein